MSSTRGLSRGALIGLWAAFVAIVVLAQKYIPAIFGWEEVDYADFAQSTDSIVQHLIVPLLAATVLVVVVASVLGWWGPILKDDRPVPRWMLLVPVLLLVVPLGATDWGRLGDMGTSYLLSLALATLIVGFNEEVMTRGILLHGFRQIGSETSAWAWSTGLFALMHASNVIAGSTLAEALPQVFSTFLVGTLFYITRRATGGLLVPILLHALWDFSLLSHGTSKGAVVPGAEALMQQLQASLPMLLFIVVMIAHKHWMSSEQPAVA